MDYIRFLQPNHYDAATGNLTNTEALRYADISDADHGVSVFAGTQVNVDEAARRVNELADASKQKNAWILITIDDFAEFTYVPIRTHDDIPGHYDARLQRNGLSNRLWKRHIRDKTILLFQHLYDSISGGTHQRVVVL
jgi:hypothetical protein